MNATIERTLTELAADDAVLEAAETAAAEAMIRTVEKLDLDDDDRLEAVLAELVAELRDVPSPEVLVNALYADLEASGWVAAKLVRSRVWGLWEELTGPR